MPRIRNIKPEYFLNEEVGKLTPLARLLFIGLWTQADREGRLKDRPVRLKLQLLPYDEDFPSLEPLLKELQKAGHILRYDAKGDAAVLILKFTEHQVVHHTERPSKIAPPTEEQLKTVKVRSLTGALQVGRGRGRGRGKGRDKRNRQPAASAPAPSPPFKDLMNRFLSECLSMKAPGGTKTEKDAVSAMYRRYGRACRDVLALADGSSELAIRGVHAIGAKLEDKGLSWTLDTIANHFADWKLNPKGFLSGK